MRELGYYSADYATARRQFRQRAQAKGAELYALPIFERRGLFIDIAFWRGTTERLVLHSTGLHGVEAFPGSAVQCAFLDVFEAQQLHGHSMALIHCINPHGMQYLRRWNANNVDLNRNFLDHFEPLPANPLYRKISTVLNPTQASQLRNFGFQALWLLTKYRFSTLQQAIVQGQYDDPEGLFFGGTEPATETRLLLRFFREHLAHYLHVRGIDFHTGLGKYRKSTFFLESDFDASDHQRLKQLLNAPVVWVKPGRRQSYQTQGGFIACLKRCYQARDFLMVTQEIGTVGPMKLLAALRMENFCYHYALGYQPVAALYLKKLFCPEDDPWKVSAVREGVGALYRLIQD